VVHLHRSNGAKAESIVADVAGYLNQIILAGKDADEVEFNRAQQTMFAIEEVRVMLKQTDYEGAAAAARDATKEWRQKT
jgi:hypothetical protein